jgi:cell division initiation protein
MFNADDFQYGETRRSMSADRSPTPTVTPVDLRQARFGTAVRGFDKAQVSAMLTEAADGYDQALRENERLRQELRHVEAALSQFRELETSLKNTLISAQKATDDMKENATQEAARIIREAEGRATLIIQKAEARREELEKDLTTLKSRRRDAEVSVEAIIATLKSTLDEFREQSKAEREDRSGAQRLSNVSRAV